MKNTIYLFALLFFWACSSSVDQEKGGSESVPKVNQKPGAVAQSTAMKRDTSPIKKRPNAVRDTSRPPSKIDKKYPYDITLKTAEGTLLNSADILKTDDKPTIVLFWLTTCGPCAMEMKAIKQKYADWQKEADFKLVAISTDFSKNYPNFVKRVQEKQWPWETYNDVHREFRKVMPGGLNGLPQTFIIDKKGNIAFHKRKYRPGDEDALFAKVKELAMK